MNDSIDDSIEALKAGQVDHVGVCLWHAQKAFFREMRNRLTVLGYADLTPANTILLPYLDIEGTRLTVLAQRAGLTKQAIGQSIKELQQLGYVIVEADPSDGRARIVRYTQKGQNFIRAGQQVKAQLQAELTERLGESAMAALMSNLADITDHLSSE